MTEQQQAQTSQEDGEGRVQETSEEQQDTGQEQGSTQATEGQESGEQETFDRQYVEKLRKEAAANRAKLKEYEDRDKTEAQKAAEERDTLKTENEKLKTGLRRAAFLESINLPSPRLAWNSLSDAGIELKYDAESRPQKQSLEAARKALREYDPQAFGASQGSADGGSRSTGEQPADMNDAIRRAAGR